MALPPMVRLRLWVNRPYGANRANNYAVKRKMDRGGQP